MPKIPAATLARRILTGQGKAPADIVIRNVKWLDLVSCKLEQGDIAITGDVIVGLGAGYEGRQVIDGAGLTAVPGFIDTHLHVESSLITPLEFDRCVLPRGTTTAICDPHEIANVLGGPGIDYFLESARHTIMDLRIMLSSCVPATHMETAGASLDAAALAARAGHEKALGLAEFMNFPGVLFADPGVLAKLEAFSDRHIDGHCPLLRGKGLNGYAAAGIRTDHETTTAEEAREKLSRGLAILIREGTVSKDLHALCEIITPETSPYLAFCTDDRNPLDIAEEGHIDFLIRTAIALGAPLPHVYRVASLSAAGIFGLKDRGLIAPGRRADINLLSSLEDCRVERVICAGRPVDDALFATRRSVAPVGQGSVKLEKVEAPLFEIAANNATQPVIGVMPGKILTQHLTATLPMKDGRLVADPGQDILKVAVLARHGINRNVGRGFVKGFGFGQGALASSVGHDSHNVTVVGASDSDMAAAVNRLIELQGGFVAVKDGKVLAELPLEVAGLIHPGRFEEVEEALIALRTAVRALGCPLPEPFLQVAFLPLPVIPHLKITDMGLVDVDKFEIIAA